MKRLLVSLLFLLTFSSSVDAGPWTQMLKGGLKEGLKQDESTNDKKSNFESFEYQLSDDEVHTGSFYLIYDSFTGETECKNSHFLPAYLELGVSSDLREYPKSLKHLFPNKSRLNKDSLFIWNEKKRNVYTKYRLDNGPIIEPDPNGIIEIPYNKWKRHKELKYRSIFYSYNPTRKYDVVFNLKELNRFVKDKRKYGCNSFMQ